MNYDINLLPKSDKPLSGFDTFLIVLVALSILLAIAYAGFYLPLSSKAKLAGEIADKENELNILNEQIANYTDLVKKAAELEQKNDAVRQLQSGYTKASQILSDIEAAMPESIIIDNMAIVFENTISIVGRSPDYRSIAQMIVNLRSLDYISEVTFNDATLQDQGYSFRANISLAIPQNDAEQGEDEA